MVGIGRALPGQAGQRELVPAGQEGGTDGHPPARSLGRACPQLRGVGSILCLEKASEDKDHAFCFGRAPLLTSRVALVPRGPRLPLGQLRRLNEYVPVKSSELARAPQKKAVITAATATGSMTPGQGHFHGTCSCLLGAPPSHPQPACSEAPGQFGVKVLCSAERGGLQEPERPSHNPLTAAGTRLGLWRDRGVGVKVAHESDPSGFQEGPTHLTREDNPAGIQEGPGASDGRAPSPGFCWKGRGREASHMSRALSADPSKPPPPLGATAPHPLQSEERVRKL